MPRKPNYEVSYARNKDGNVVIRLTRTIDIPFYEFAIESLPTSCMDCPIGYQNIPNNPCGRNIPFKGEDYSRRPPTCKLITIREYLKRKGMKL